MRRSFTLTPRVALAASLLYILLWQGLVRFAGWLPVNPFGWNGPDLPQFVWRSLEVHTEFHSKYNVIGLVGLYLLGLAWLVWLIERAAQRIEQRVQRGRSAADVLIGRRPAAAPRFWNPLNPEAWYYGRHGQRFRQTLAMVVVYSSVFLGLYFVQFPTQAKGNDLDPFELPGGGGSDSPAGAPMQVQVKKVVRKKIVLNPYSAVTFNVPAIDTVDLKIMDATKNDYQAGQIGFGGEGGGDGDGTGGYGSGKGNGGGFGMGTGTGKLRFFRLKHSDRSWDKNFGIAGDQNMWNQFKTFTRFPSSKFAENPEPVDFTQLAGFPDGKAPPFLFVAGTNNFKLAAEEKRILKQYLLERHGMIFADNLGGRNFHNEFFAAMREVTGVEEVVIPRDDHIHKRPREVPSLPIVVAHGGTVPYGWKVDGRWVVYYHPGAISDAWRDDHAGIKREVWEESYRLGINVMDYAYRGYNQWLQARKKS